MNLRIIMKQFCLINNLQLVATEKERDKAHSELTKYSEVN